MRLALFSIAAAISFIFWFLLTDAIYCLTVFRIDMFDWPFTAWLNDWPARNYSTWVRLRWWGSPIIPAIILIRVLWQYRNRLFTSFTGLYGQSGWASAWQRRRSGIRHNRRPF